MPSCATSVQALCGCADLVNDVYACESGPLNQLLTGNANFSGFMVSDYDGTRSTANAALHGLDIAMPGPPMRPPFFGPWLKAAVLNGTVPEVVVTDKAVRIVSALATVGALDHPNNTSAASDVTSRAHVAFARELATAAATLLRNQAGTLPLRPAALSSVAVFGLAAEASPIFGGGGSGAVVGKSPSTVLAALTSRLGVDIVSYSDGTNATSAAALAAGSNVSIVVLAQSSSEGKDRATLKLDQSDLVDLVAEAAKKTVVVAVSPGPFLTPWASAVGAILDLGYPGEQEGEAAADVLLGVVSPSGKLPHSMPNA